MTVTTLVRPEDRPAVHGILRDAFGDEGELITRLVDALDQARLTRASLGAEQDGQLVGHVQLSQSWVDAREGLVEVLVLSPLAVAPRAQRQGVGGILVEAALAHARQAGAPAVFLEGDPRYYGRHGFERASAHGFSRPSTRIPEAACQVAVLAAWEPWMTGALVYCDPFWALDCVGLRDPLLSRIESAAAGDPPTGP